VNRGGKNISGEVLSVPHNPNNLYFDAYHGVKITPTNSNGNDILSISLIEDRGYGCIVSLSSPDNKFIQFMDTYFLIFTSF